MIKSKTFQRTFFGAEVLSEALDALKNLCPSTDGDAELEFQSLHVETSDEEWHYDTFGEFLADYRTARYAYLAVKGPGPPPNLNVAVQFFLTARGSPPFTKISVGGPSRDSIESLFEVFERRAADCMVPNTADEAGDSHTRPTIFIGHGQSALWKDLKDQHGYPVEAYEAGARAGHAIRDILQEMMASSALALLVLTGDDRAADGTYRARTRRPRRIGPRQRPSAAHTRSPTANRARPWRSRPWTAPYPGLPHRQSVSIPPALDENDARRAVCATITPSEGPSWSLQE